MRLAIIIAAVLLPTAAAAQTSKFELGRKLYAISEAGPEYCPDIETRWGTTMTIAEVFGYRPPTEMDELHRMQAEKDQLFQTFRKVPVRSIVCDMLMDEYGPGARFELFQFD